MKTLVIYLGMAAIGYVLGGPLRKHREKLHWIGKLLTIVVLSIVFTMGIKIGSNEEVIHNMASIGLYSFILAVVPLGATIGLLFVTRKRMGFNRYGRYGEEEPSEINGNILMSKGEKIKDRRRNNIFSNSTIRIAFAVLLGLALGYFTVLIYQMVSYEVVYKISGIYITYALYTMVFLVGLDLGLDGNALNMFRKAGVRIFAFPLATAIATVTAVLLCSLVMPLTLRESLGIACTFCWYSLGPNIIMDAGLVTAGAIAFLANFMRVIISLFTIPLVARKIGYIETIGMPIAASMDVCIATIERATNKETAVYAFVSGCIYTAVVPLLVPIVVG